MKIVTFKRSISFIKFKRINNSSGLKKYAPYDKRLKKVKKNKEDHIK